MIATALLLCFLPLATVANSPPPTIDLTFGDTSIRLAADRAWDVVSGRLPESSVESGRDRVALR